MELQGQQKKQLKLLKKKYNKALARFYDMERWCETAPIEEQRKYEPNILEVINKCNDTLNEIKKHINVTQEEILRGFKIWMY